MIFAEERANLSDPNATDVETVARLETLNEETLQQINPRVADAIRAIQAERAGHDPIRWSDFSSHNKG